MLEHAPGRQHHRIVVIRQFVRGHHMRRHDLAAAARGREPRGEDDLVAGLIGIIDRIGHRALAHQPFPGDVLQGWHHLRHLGEDICRTVIVPGQSHPFGDFLDDPQILPRVAGRLDDLARELNAAVGIGEGAGFFRECRGRQDHVGMERRFGDEQVLHHEMIEFCQRLARMLQVGIRHRGVLALDIHAGDFAGVDRVHDLDHGETANLI